MGLRAMAPVEGAGLAVEVVEVEAGNMPTEGTEGSLRIAAPEEARAPPAEAAT